MEEPTRRLRDALRELTRAARRLVDAANVIGVLCDAGGAVAADVVRARQSVCALSLGEAPALEAALFAWTAALHRSNAKCEAAKARGETLSRAAAELLERLRQTAEGAATKRRLFLSALALLESSPLFSEGELGGASLVEESLPEYLICALGKTSERLYESADEIQSQIAKHVLVDAIGGRTAEASEAPRANVWSDFSDWKPFARRVESRANHSRMGSALTSARAVDVRFGRTSRRGASNGKSPRCSRRSSADRFGSSPKCLNEVENRPPNAGSSRRAPLYCRQSDGRSFEAPRARSLRPPTSPALGRGFETRLFFRNSEQSTDGRTPEKDVRAPIGLFEERIWKR